MMFHLNRCSLEPFRHKGLDLGFQCTSITDCLSEHQPRGYSECHKLCQQCGSCSTVCGSTQYTFVFKELNACHTCVILMYHSPMLKPSILSLFLPFDSWNSPRLVVRP